MRICRFNQFINNLFTNEIMIERQNSSESEGVRVKNLLFFWISIILQILNINFDLEIFKEEKLNAKK